MPNKPQRYKATKTRPPEDRPSASARGYDDRWRKASRRFLNGHPVCVRCEQQGRLTGATVVDHVVPHKGDRDLFWDESNWQSLCAKCHNSKTVQSDGGLGRRPTTDRR